MTAPTGIDAAIVAPRRSYRNHLECIEMKTGSVLFLGFGLVCAPTAPLSAQQYSAAVKIDSPPASSGQPVRWIAMTDSGRVLSRGVTPAEVDHAGKGTAVVFCSEDGVAWLALTVEVTSSWNPFGGTMRATGACTKVTVDGKKVSTVGTADPRRSK